MISPGSSILAIEIGASRFLLLRGALSGGRLRLNGFASEELITPNPENAAQQLQALIDREQWSSMPAALALSGPEVIHRVLEFPPMPSSELALVVGREIRVVEGVGKKDVVFDWEVIEESQSAGPKRVRVLVAVAARSRVDGALRLLEFCRLKPLLLTTAPIALLRSLKFLQGEFGGILVILYIGAEEGYVLGAKEGAWSFFREFSSRSSEPGVDTLQGEALKEVSRVLLYYKQQHRGEGEMPFLLAGGTGLEELRGRLQREMGIEGDIVQPGPMLDLTGLKERSRVFLADFPSFMIPLGLLAATAQAGINLGPKVASHIVLPLPRINLPRLNRYVVTAVVLLVCLAVHLILLRYENYYQKLLEERSTLYAEWLPAIRASEESRVLRDNERLLAQALGSSRAVEASWVILFKLLSRLLPPDLILQTVTVKRDEAGWALTLKGQTMAADLYTAQVAFNRFYQSLKRSPQLEITELLPLDVSSITERLEAPAKVDQKETEAALATRQGPEIRKTRIQFEIHGQLKGI